MGTSEIKSDDFDGQLVIGIGKVVAANFNPSVDWMLDRVRALPNYDPSMECDVTYPPALFFRDSESPVLLPIEGRTLAKSILREKSEERVSRATGHGMVNDSDRFGNNAELVPMLRANQRDILDIIYRGRIRISFLLNSFGGEVEVGDPIVNLIKYIRENGGVIDAYASSFADSMAGEIFNNADNRFALNDSLIMWHAANAESFTEEQMRQALAEHKQLLSDFFMRSVRADKRDDIMAVLNRVCTDPQTPRGDIWMNGEQLADHGITTRVFDCLDDLEKFFIKRTAVNPASLLDRSCYLDRFFSISALEEHMRRNIGVAAKIEKDKNRKWNIAGVVNMEPSTFSATGESSGDWDRITTFVRQFPDFKKPDLVGHNLRLMK